jgi:hypothetical protein
MRKDFDEMEPWEQYEELTRGEAKPEAMAESGERLLTFWKQLMMGTYTGDRYGASPATVARVLKVFSDADLLLTRLVGCGAIRTGIWFDPRFADSQADEIERAQGSDPVVETLRQVARAWLDEPALAAVPPLTPHFLMAAMLYWSQGDEFAWSLYTKMMPRIFQVHFNELLVRLNLVRPAQAQHAAGVIDAVEQLPVKISAPVFVRFTGGPARDITKDFGPYVWVEMVHNELKVAPTGRHLATLHFNGGTPCWEVADPSVPGGTFFTNMVSGPAEVPDGWVQPDDEPAGEPGG